MRSENNKLAWQVLGTWRMLTGQNHVKDKIIIQTQCWCDTEGELSPLSHTDKSFKLWLYSVALTNPDSFVLRGQRSPWSTGRWWCTWRSAALCPACAVGSWCVPLSPQSTGLSLRWEASCSPPPTTTPTCGWTVSQTPRGCPTASITPPCWPCLVGHSENFKIYNLKFFSCIIKVYAVILNRRFRECMKIITVGRGAESYIYILF